MYIIRVKDNAYITQDDQGEIQYVSDRKLAKTFLSASIAIDLIESSKFKVFCKDNEIKTVEILSFVTIYSIYKAYEI